MGLGDVSENSSEFYISSLIFDVVAMSDWSATESTLSAVAGLDVRSLSPISCSLSLNWSS